MKWFVLAPANNSIMYDQDERLCGRWSMGSNQSTQEMKVVVLYGIIYDEGTSLFSFGHRTQMSSFLCFLFFVLFLSQNISFNAFLFVRPRNVYRNYYHNRRLLHCLQAAFTFIPSKSMRSSNAPYPLTENGIQNSRTTRTPTPKWVFRNARTQIDSRPECFHWKHSLRNQNDTMHTRILAFTRAHRQWNDTVYNI